MKNKRTVRRLSLFLCIILLGTLLSVFTEHILPEEEEEASRELSGSGEELSSFEERGEEEQEDKEGKTARNQQESKETGKPQHKSESEDQSSTQSRTGIEDQNNTQSQADTEDRDSTQSRNSSEDRDSTQNSDSLEESGETESIDEPEDQSPIPYQSSAEEENDSKESSSNQDPPPHIHEWVEIPITSYVPPLTEIRLVEKEIEVVDEEAYEETVWRIWVEFSDGTVMEKTEDEDMASFEDAITLYAALHNVNYSDHEESSIIYHEAVTHKETILVEEEVVIEEGHFETVGSYRYCRICGLQE